jgi:hypothetical protein
MAGPGARVRAEEGVLFIGDGVHAAPPPDSPFTYPDEHRPVLGAALARQLSASLGFHDDEAALPSIALHFEVATSRTELVAAVRDAVQTGRRPSPMVRALAELPFPLIISTVQDRLLEDALKAAGKEPHVTVYTPAHTPTEDHRLQTADRPLVLKLRGDVSRPETLVLTEEDYTQLIIRMGEREPYDPVPLWVKYGLTSWITLIVGYPLSDSNRRLLQMLQSRIEPVGPGRYLVDFESDPLILSLWADRRRYAEVIPGDVWSFVPLLYEQVLGRPLTPAAE